MHPSTFVLSGEQRAAVGVVNASRGYPALYEKGKPISGPERSANLEDVLVFHAGTREADFIRWDGVHDPRDIGPKVLQRKEEGGK